MIVKIISEYYSVNKRKKPQEVHSTDLELISAFISDIAVHISI